MEINIFQKSAQKIEVSSKSNKSKGTLHEDRCTFMIICRSIIRSIRNTLDKFVEKIKTQFIFVKLFFRKSCLLWDNVEKYGTAGPATDDNITRRKHTACWVNKAADTQRIWNAYCFPRQPLVSEPASALRYTCISLHDASQKYVCPHKAYSTEEWQTNSREYKLHK